MGPRFVFQSLRFFFFFFFDNVDDIDNVDNIDDMVGNVSLL